MVKHRADGGGDPATAAATAATTATAATATASAATGAVTAADVIVEAVERAERPARGAGSRSGGGGNGNLTNYQRKIICEYYQKTGGVMSQKDLAQWTRHEFNLKRTPAQSTISGILRRQHEFAHMSSLELGIKKRRVVQHPALDNALANWVIQCAHRGIAVQGDRTKEKAKHFARMLQIPEDEQPEFSNGWLHSFQLRHNFSFRKFNADQHHHHNLRQQNQEQRQASASASATIKTDGESVGATTTATASAASAATRSASPTDNRRVVYFSTMEALVDETDKYLPKDVFAMDETVVLYTLPPTLNALQEAPMRAKKRFVAALASNADGSEKLQPLFVSHHDQPKCFRKKTAEQHGLHYFWNHKAWMTGVIFSRWIQRLDFAMASQKRHILLFINEVASHVVSHLELSNVVVFVLPAGASQMLNPITSGLLSTFKKRFRRRHLRCAIDRHEATKVLSFDVDVLQAMKWAVASWDEVPSATIERAWMTTHLVRDRLTLEPDVDQEEDAFLDTELEHLLLLLKLPDLMPVSELLNDEALADNPVHEEFFDIVQSVGDVPEDDVDENADASSVLGASSSIQEKFKAFREALHVLKDRSDVDSGSMKTAGAASELTHDEHAAHALDLGEPSASDMASAAASDAIAMTSLDADEHHHMDASSLLESSEHAALSIASAALAEATAVGEAADSMLDETHVAVL